MTDIVCAACGGGQFTNLTGSNSKWRKRPMLLARCFYCRLWLKLDSKNGPIQTRDVFPGLSHEFYRISQ